jgi:hypothetical protein
MSTIDSIFMATNFEEVDQQYNPDKALCRYEFYEIIVRVAIEKYIKSRICITLTGAVGKLLWENIFKYSDFAIPSQKWRKEELWTCMNNDLYHANLDTFKLLYSVSYKYQNLDDIHPTFESNLFG